MLKGRRVGSNVGAMLFRFVIFAVLACFAALRPAQAHPHVFIDVGLEFQTDEQGRVTAVDVVWVYDRLFTLLILSDYGLDNDADFVLTGEEQEQLTGFDLNDWPQDFEGALHIEGADGKIVLGPPEVGALSIEHGQLMTRHRRAFAPTELNGVIVRPFDPTFYAAMTLNRAVLLPEGCTGRVDKPDLDKADALVESLGGANADEAVFEEALIGSFFADTLVVTCED